MTTRIHQVAAAMLPALALVSCVAGGRVVSDLESQAFVYRRQYAEERQTTARHLAERRRLQSRIARAEQRERQIQAGGIASTEQAEFTKVQGEIRVLRKQLADLASAG